MKEIYNKIRKLGGRITKIRKLILQVLYKKDCLLSQVEINECLVKQGIFPDRSTIFREMQFLVTHNIIVKNTISGTDYFEIQNEHHHHIVCLKCNIIKKVKISNHLEEQERKISKDNKFSITNHSLDFYGYCCNCNVKSATKKA